jgi:hypothetical protein
VIEEYEEEVLVQEEAPKPPVADFANTSPAWRQAPVHNPYFEYSPYIYIYIYMLCAFTFQELYENYMHKCIHLWVLLVQAV